MRHTASLYLRYQIPTMLSMRISYSVLSSLLSLVEMYRRIRITCNMYADDGKGKISSHNLP